MAKILTALSGGVDSSVATALLQRQGHDVVAIYMKNWTNEDAIPGDCPWRQDLEDAEAVATKLKIEFRVIDFTKIYKEKIVTYLLEGYRAGLTPNPDVWCNREIKFGALLDYALAQKFDGVATGHYARKARAADGSEFLLRGADPGKDQSYFLAMLSKTSLRYCNFPLGDLLKSQVRLLAADMRLPNAAKKDSQGICFIGKIKMRDFLRRYLPDNPGEIVDAAGAVLGAHPGLHLYTLGQRQGLGVASPREGCAYVVVAKDAANNRLIVDWEQQGADSLFLTTCRVVNLNWLCAAPRFGAIAAQPRYRAKAEPALLREQDADSATLTFARPQRAVSPGQICAFYDGGKLIGGGVFAAGK